MIWLVLDSEGLYSAAREGDLLLHTGTRRAPSDAHGPPGWGDTLFCFLLRGKPCHLAADELDRVRRSLRLVSAAESA